MIRRFQFSLRTLLVTVVALGTALGSRQAYVTHFSSYIVAESPKVGNPIRLRGQFFIKDGPLSTDFLVGVGKPRTALPQWSFKCRANRIGIGTYRFAEQMPPSEFNPAPSWNKAGSFDLFFLPFDGRVIVSHVVVKP